MDDALYLLAIPWHILAILADLAPSFSFFLGGGMRLSLTDSTILLMDTYSIQLARLCQSQTTLRLGQKAAEDLETGTKFLLQISRGTGGLSNQS